MNNNKHHSQTEKAAWESPVIETHGSLQELTREVEGPGPGDFAFADAFDDGVS